MWYQNAIGYVVSLQIRGPARDASSLFYFRNKEGVETIIDLNTNALIDPRLVLNRTELDKMTIAEAVNLIQSERSQDRQTAAIHLGHLGSRKHFSTLTNLLNDKASFTQISGNERKTVYFVKDAAEKAIEMIKQRETANKLSEAIQ